MKNIEDYLWDEQEAFEKLSALKSQLMDEGHTINFNCYSDTYGHVIATMKIDNEAPYTYRENRVGCINAYYYLMDYINREKQKERFESAQKFVSDLEAKMKTKIEEDITENFGAYLSEPNPTGTGLQKVITNVISKHYNCSVDDITFQSIQPLTHRKTSGLNPDMKKDYIIEFEYQGIPQKFEIYHPNHQKEINNWKNVSYDEKAKAIYSQFLEKKKNTIENMEPKKELSDAEIFENITADFHKSFEALDTSLKAPVLSYSKILIPNSKEIGEKITQKYAALLNTYEQEYSHNLKAAAGIVNYPLVHQKTATQKDLANIVKQVLQDELQKTIFIQSIGPTDEHSEHDLVAKFVYMDATGIHKGAVEFDYPQKERVMDWKEYDTEPEYEMDK